MESDPRYRASHPQAWPIIAVYGAVVMGIAVFSYVNHDKGDRTGAYSTSVASADITPRFASPHSSGITRLTEHSD